ncbi:hypothetical protein HLB44_15995 [Aquincola sp. S2]|uniref:Translation initiation factor IF-2 n=1 Tax=Pseudaquabacterium terrae TaxID=2732868 RepID=A0ABX2EIT5_9BURK|nr:hypothetical protein [Aquabacterium terrae]NRF68497.1 hypothetical protein [Aquabacterium terrae]
MLDPTSPLPRAGAAPLRDNTGGADPAPSPDATVTRAVVAQVTQSPLPRGSARHAGTEIWSAVTQSVRTLAAVEAADHSSASEQVDSAGDDAPGDADEVDAEAARRLREAQRRRAAESEEARDADEPSAPKLEKPHVPKPLKPLVPAAKPFVPADAKPDPAPARRKRPAPAGPVVAATVVHVVRVGRPGSRSGHGSVLLRTIFAAVLLAGLAAIVLPGSPGAGQGTGPGTAEGTGHGTGQGTGQAKGQGTGQAAKGAAAQDSAGCRPAAGNCAKH